MTGPVLKRNESRNGGRRRVLSNVEIERPKSRRRYWLMLGMASSLALAWTAGPMRLLAERRDDGSKPASTFDSSPIPDDTALPERSDKPRPAAIALIEPTESADRVGPATHRALEIVSGDRLPEALDAPIARALRAIEECQERFDRVRDYVCTFVKRERIDGRLGSPHVMYMKARTQPRSVYLKFRQPAAGREAIFIEGRHDGKVLAHDVGLGRLIAGTLHLDPRGARAMSDCRHPITEAGIGPMLDTLEARWTAELDSRETRVNFCEKKVGSRPCHRITVTHSRKSPDYMFYRVHLYIDDALGLPIHFEAFDWPEAPDAEPPLVEEYSYNDLELNVGLSEIDFDVSNSAYAFGRF